MAILSSLAKAGWSQLCAQPLECLSSSRIQLTYPCHNSHFLPCSWACAPSAEHWSCLLPRHDRDRVWTNGAGNGMSFFHPRCRFCGNMDSATLTDNGSIWALRHISCRRINTGMYNWQFVSVGRNQGNQAGSILGGVGHFALMTCFSSVCRASHHLYWCNEYRQFRGYQSGEADTFRSNDIP